MLRAAVLTGVLASLGLAQSPLNTLTGGTNQGNVGGGIYFNLQINTTVTITQIDFRCGANTVAGTGTLDVYLGPTTYENNIANPAAWTLVSTTGAVTVNPSAVSTGILTTPIGLAPGNYGVALKSNAFNHGYTNGVTCTSNTTPGACANSLFSTAEMTLRAGAAQNLFLSGPINSPRVFNGTIHYTLGGTPIRVASWESFGKGCYGYYKSFYQFFPNPVGFNLGGTNPVTAIRLALQGGTYLVSSVNSPVIAPTSPPINLTNGDQTFNASTAFPNQQLPFPIPHPSNGAVQSATDLAVSSDGYIVPAPAVQAHDATPTVAEFLAQAPRWAPHWKNMNVATAGSSIHVEFHAPSGALLVTWNNVADNGGTATSTFQVAFFPFGDVEFRYGTMSGLGGGVLPVLAGWTEGNGALDRGNIEIATSLPFSTDPTDNAPLTLESSARPVLGATINAVTSEIPNGSALGVMLIAATAQVPGLDLVFIQAPSCFLNVQPLVNLSFPISGSSVALPLAIPTSTNLNGGRLMLQSVTVSPGFNGAGLLTSNGVRLNLGSL